MKKKITLTSSFLLSAGLMMAQSFTVDGINYNVLEGDGNRVEVGENPELIGKITIPSTVTDPADGGQTYTVTKIGSKAFYKYRGSAVEAVILPETIDTIAELAFNYCNELTELNIPASVKFFDCNNFSNSPKFATITVDSENPFFIAEAGVLFNKDKSVLLKYPSANIATEFTTPDATTTIGETAIKYATNLKTLNLGSAVDSIAENALQGSKSIETVNFADDSKLAYIGAYSFDELNISSLTIPSTVKFIGQNAFRKCASLETVNFPANCADITFEANVFGPAGEMDACLWLNNQEDGVVYANDIVLEYKGDLPADGAITVKEGTKVLVESCFSQQKMTSVTLPSTLTTIGKSAFHNCSALESVTIPASVKSIGEGAFNLNKANTAYVVEEGNSNYSSLDGVLYDINKTVLINYPVASATKSVVIASTVDSIAPKAFYKATKLSNVTIPESATKIGSDAFAYSSIVDITVPSSVTSLGGSEFSGCDSLRTATINSSYVSESMFNGCDSLKAVTLGSGVETILKYGFGNCKKLETIKSYAVVAPVATNGKWDNSFNNVPTTVVVTVPEGSLASYEASASWSLFVLQESESTSVEQLETTIPFEQYGNEIIFAQAEQFAVYNITGACVFNGVAQSYTLEQKAVYIIVTSNGSYKVIGR